MAAVQRDTAIVVGAATEEMARFKAVLAPLW
jgi:hypothetical protein